MQKPEVEKIWANSADSHFLEPEDIWERYLPKRLADLAPKSVDDGDHEIIQWEGKSVRRRKPTPVRDGEFKGMDIRDLTHRPPGARDVKQRLKDLDDEGIWGEVVYPSLGLWLGLVRDRELYREGVRVMNDWVASEVLAASPRLVATAQVPILDIEDAVAEVARVVGIGFKAVSLPTLPPEVVPDWNDRSWDPLWKTAEEAGLVVCFHIGSDATAWSDTSNATHTVVYRGPGGAVLNYVETTYSGQRTAMKLVASGVLEDHPGMRVLISEGGATWVPFMGDRMNEGYRQHGMFVRPTLARLPKEYLYEQVYASFQHDESAVAAFTAMGYRNVMWGSDYPHLEGTFGHTQKTLHELFDGVDDKVRYDITVGNFHKLFPHVGLPPGVVAPA